MAVAWNCEQLNMLIIVRWETRCESPNEALELGHMGSVGPVSRSHYEETAQNGYKKPLKHLFQSSYLTFS